MPVATEKLESLGRGGSASLGIKFYSRISPILGVASQRDLGVAVVGEHSGCVCLDEIGSRFWQSGFRSGSACLYASPVACRSWPVLVGNPILVPAGTNIGNPSPVPAGTVGGNPSLVPAGTTVGNPSLVPAGTTVASSTPLDPDGTAFARRAPAVPDETVFARRTPAVPVGTVFACYPLAVPGRTALI